MNQNFAKCSTCYYSHFTDETKAQRDDMIQMLVSGFQVWKSSYCAVLTTCKSRRQSANLLGLGGGLTCQETHPAVHLGIRMWEGCTDTLSFYNKAPTQGCLDGRVMLPVRAFKRMWLRQRRTEPINLPARSVPQEVVANSDHWLEFWYITSLLSTCYV